MMTTDPVRRLLSASPFEPFAIHLADGRESRVSHPDAAMLQDRGRTVVVLNEQGALEILDMLLIASLRPLQAQETTQAP